MMKQANQQAINVVWLVDKKFVKLCFLLRKLIKVVLSGERNGITAVNLSGTVFTQILSQPNYSLSALLIFFPLCKNSSFICFPPPPTSLPYSMCPANDLQHCSAVLLKNDDTKRLVLVTKVTQLTQA